MDRVRVWLYSTCLGCMLVMLPGKVISAGLLDEVRDRGYVRCAVSDLPLGDARIGETGYEGFFPEFCRVVALALFDDRDAVELSPMLIRYGLQSISEGEVDIYISHVTWTLSRDLGLGLTPAAVLFYDGQGFLSHKGTVNGTLAELDQARVCVSRSTTTILNLEDYIRQHGLSWEPVSFESSEGRNDAFFSKRCDLLTADRLVLTSIRSTAVEDPDNYVLHREVISKEPLVAYVRSSDMAWGNVVRWAIMATVAAEELGLSRDNLSDHFESSDAAVRRLLGIDPLEASESMGLDPLWARNIIAESGNYGEIFDRYLGEHSANNIDRGLNNLWTQGGLMYSPPFR